MGIINNLETVADTHERRQQTTIRKATIRVVNAAAGRCLRIDTYGSETREVRNQPSQTMQFSPQAITQLRAFLENLE